MSYLNSNRGESIYDAYPNIQWTGKYQTNNVYQEYPPLMSDGRSVMASWQPGDVINQKIMEASGITSNWQYRKFLMENADQIRQENFRFACNDSGVVKNVQSLPWIETKFTSDLKENYLTREQLNARRVIPVMTQAELVKRLAS